MDAFNKKLCLLSMFKEQPSTHINLMFAPAPPSSLCLQRLPPPDPPPPPSPPHTHDATLILLSDKDKC
jgi:hypothetical protein